MAPNKGCPAYGYYGGKEDNVELWRIYFPKKKQYRFLTNWKAKQIQGYKQLPKSGKLLVITKSPFFTYSIIFYIKNQLFFCIVFISYIVFTNY